MKKIFNMAKEGKPTKNLVVKEAKKESESIPEQPMF